MEKITDLCSRDHKDNGLNTIFINCDTTISISHDLIQIWSFLKQRECLWPRLAVRTHYFRVGQVWTPLYSCSWSSNKAGHSNDLSPVPVYHHLHSSHHGRKLCRSAFLSLLIECSDCVAHTWISTIWQKFLKHTISLKQDGSRIRSTSYDYLVYHLLPRFLFYFILVFLTKNLESYVEWIRKKKYY